MSIKFVHYRYEDIPGCVSGNGGVTIAYRWVAGSPEEIRMGVARCAPEDRFNKRIARDIALGRLMSTKPNRCIILDVSDLTTKLTPQAVEEIIWGWLDTKLKEWNEPWAVQHTINGSGE